MVPQTISSAILLVLQAVMHTRYQTPLQLKRKFVPTSSQKVFIADYGICGARLLEYSFLRAISIASPISALVYKFFTSRGTICSLSSTERDFKAFPASCVLVSKFATGSFWKMVPKIYSRFCFCYQVSNKQLREVYILCIFAGP